MTGREAVIDSSAWITILEGDPRGERVGVALEGRRVVLTPIVLAELAAWRKRRGSGNEVLTAVENHARYEPLTREDALAGADVYARLRQRKASKVSLADALIYATARRIGAILITRDRDLAGEPDVAVVS